MIDNSFHLDFWESYTIQVYEEIKLFDLWIYFSVLILIEDLFLL